MSCCWISNPPQTGEKFPLTLKFERGGEIQVQVEVRNLRGGAAH